MILGIGTDLCDIRRIEKIRTRHQSSFDNKILTQREREELIHRSDKNAYVAKRFAAKEAIYKAFQFTDQDKIGWQDAEILNSGNKGAPVVSLYANCLNKFNQQLAVAQTGAIHLSLTDEYPYVMAYVIIEKNTNSI
ncbi:holo-ACP synthase [Alphaproteobacteria bacterium]|nr:holo-ACP synthase [Alphaproteobacteria bacterium]